MANWTNYYLFRIEFLGFRYHGWQLQSKFRSVQGMVDKTLEFIFQHTNFKTLGCGRTDAKVSANDFAFELFTVNELDCDAFLATFNQNLPSDIRAKSIEVVDAKFNIIQQSKIKEYHYFFSSGKKSHPFNGPFIRDFGAQLNIAAMQEGAKIFEGIHNFKRYASKPSSHTIFEREILSCKIVENEILSGSFVPPTSFVFKIRAAGFLRYQVRLMMGALVDLGRGHWTKEDLLESLTNPEGMQIRHIAPSSGLVLHSVEF